MTPIETLTKFLTSVQRNSIKSKHAYESALHHFQAFLSQKYCSQNNKTETILNLLARGDVNVYELLDDFIANLVSTNPNLTPASIKLYVTAVRSYLAYYDIDVIPSKFRRKVRMPKLYHEDEEPLDAEDIRRILLSCSNRRLKVYLLVLASSGARASEALAIRIKDIDFTTNPTRIHIRKEYSKTRIARDVYISDEATQYLKQWLDWKYKNRERPRKAEEDDLVFTIYKSKTPHGLYFKLLIEFQKLLTIVGLDKRKEDGVQKRRKITLHSFRRFVKTVVSDQTNQDYSEWFLGHNKSPYYTKKENDRRQLYATKCMKYLTFLDYSTIEATGKNIEAKLSEKEKEIELLRQRDSINTDAIAGLSDQLASVMREIEVLKNQPRQ
ncbi:MAG TPA: tyrosine-type recombinase/integrase [Nitrososphaeraceae archaeon]